MSLPLVLAQLHAMRLILDGVITMLEQAMVELHDEPPPAPSLADQSECPHPAERQVNATVMGGLPHVLCLVCGQQRPGTAP